MRQGLDKIKRWLFPPWWATLPLAAVSAAALYLTFTRGLEETALAYAAYLLSAYALAAAVGLTVRACRPLWRRVRAIPLVVRWREDAYFRVWAGLALSFPLNLCYAGLWTTYAALRSSFWDGAQGFYYLLLCAVRLYLLRRTPKAPGDMDRRRELKVCRWAGCYLMALNLALLWLSVQIVREGQSYDYPGTLIYAAAGYSFYCLTIAVVNLVKYRRFHSPVLSASRAVSLTCAAVSIFSLETAMLTRFGGDAQFRAVMTSSTAAAVCALVLGIAAFLIISSSRKLKHCE